jgi:uncharacterized protein with HEPN domain
VPPTLADRLAHILDAILSIEDLLSGKTQADIEKDRHLRMSLEREFEVISEASRKIPDQIRAEEADIDWQNMAALGNRLRHAYHRVDAEILFTIAAADLPPLKAFVQRVIDEENKK